VKARSIRISRIEAGQYTVVDVDTGEEVAHIYKDPTRVERPWVFSDHTTGDMLSSRSLADAKDVAHEELER
jgi:hypothetical protein